MPRPKSDAELLNGSKDAWNRFQALPDSFSAEKLEQEFRSEKERLLTCQRKDLRGVQLRNSTE